MPVKPIVVGIDVRSLKTAQTGTRTYLEELCKSFKNIDDDSIKFHFLDTSAPTLISKNKLFKWIGHVRYQIWKQLILPVKAWYNNCDILFCTDECVPLIRIGYKTVAVIHDAFCFESPESYGKLWLWLYLNTAIPAARKAAFVITPTTYAKKQITFYTKIPDSKLKVIYEGPKTFPLTDTSNDSSTLKSLRITSKKYILHVGSMYKRKNLLTLIKAFNEFKKEGHNDIKLVLAGPVPANSIDSDYLAIVNIIESLHLQNEVIITGYLPDEAIGQLYKNALLYVFPSLNEGFGIPILEAFRQDLPVIIANNTCLPEVGGDAAIAFDPYSTDDLLLKINMVLNDAHLQRLMIIKGRDRLSNFSWQNTAVQIIKIFKEAADC